MSLAATPLPRRSHSTPNAEPRRCQGSKSPMNPRELFEGVRGSCLASVWKMEHRPEFTEEKTSYELERDKRVVNLVKKLFPVTEAAAEL
jgi:hypothetical protein